MDIGMQSQMQSDKPRGFAGRVVGNFADAFLLRGEEAWARRLREGDRNQLDAQVARARQKLESARLLWAHEQYVEGLRLGEEAVVEALRAAEFTGGLLGPTAGTGSSANLPVLTSGRPIWAEALVSLGATTEDIEDATVAMGGPLGPRPTSNADLRPEHRRFFRSATRVSEAVLGLLAPLVTAPLKIVTTRWVRLGAIVAVLAAFGAAALAVRRRVEVRASGSFNEVEHEPGRIIDGNPNTEWLLPTGAQGFIEITSGARTVKTVKLLNSRNPPYHDRATKDFRLELVRDKKVLQSTKHSFAKLEEKPEWMTIAVPNLKADTVRVVIDSHHKVGGGLAEVKVE